MMISPDHKTEDTKQNYVLFSTHYGIDCTELIFFIHSLLVYVA